VAAFGSHFPHLISGFPCWGAFSWLPVLCRWLEAGERIVQLPSEAALFPQPVGTGFKWSLFNLHKTQLTFIIIILGHGIKRPLKTSAEKSFY
jgi:hypothetical protein